jgi:hypothetical protein
MRKMLTRASRIRIFLDMTDLPTLLRVQRASRRWRQERAALELGWTNYRYRRIELAFARATASEVGEIAALFGLSARDVAKAAKVTRLIGEAASVA